MMCMGEVEHGVEGCSERQPEKDPKIGSYMARIGVKRTNSGFFRLPLLVAHAIRLATVGKTVGMFPLAASAS